MENIKNIQVGNGQYVSVFFILPVILDIHDHRFELFTLISEINENVDFVLGKKNVFGCESIITSRESLF